LTPPGKPETSSITAFDVFESKTGILYIAAAQEQLDGTSVMLHTSFAKPALRFDSESSKVTGFDSTQVSWVSIKNNVGNKQVTSIKCGPPIGRLISTSSTSKAPFTIFVGTAQHGNLAGAYHSIDPAPDAPEPWLSEAGPEVTDEVLEMRSAAVTGMGPAAATAYVALFKTSQGNSCTLRRVDPETGKRGPFTRFATGALGQPRGIGTSLNPWG
jgi:hypothetical protein